MTIVGTSFSMQTELGPKWASKPIREGLVAPALAHYAKHDLAAPKLAPENVQIHVRGELVDGATPSKDYVVDIAEAVDVTITIPAGVQTFNIKVEKGK